MCVGFAIVSMVGTNFHDSKLIKGDSAPGPNEIGPRAQVRSGPMGPRPFWTPEGKGSYKIAVVCPYLRMSVTKINFVNFLKIGSYDFFLNLAQ